MSLYNQLLEAVRPLGKHSVKFKLFPVNHSSAQEVLTSESRMESKFGGLPYIADDEIWPICPSCCDRLTFICQANLYKAGYYLPGRVCAFTFFYCQNCMPWGDCDEREGLWHVRLYTPERFSTERMGTLSAAWDNKEITECRIEFHPSICYPDGWSLHLYSPAACNIIGEMEDDWDAYARVIQELGGIGEDDSYLGGYPAWDQQHESYAPLDFFATIASEDKASLLFGDCGHVNFFVRSDGSGVPLMMRQSG